MAVPNTIELIGPLRQLEMPPICANCGNATSESLDVAKVFRHVDQHESAPDTFSVARATVPFCPPCTAQHHSEVRLLTPAQRFRMIFRSNSGKSALGFTVLTLLVMYMGTRRPDALLIWGIAACLAAVVASCVWAGYHETEYLAVPPPTSITSAFDFSEDHAQMFEREHRTVILRNPVFAEVFLARNGPHVWNPDDPRNRRATSARNLLINIAAAAVVLWLAWLILKSWR